mmetsp:Transcript_81523/g.231007  ORF Transcript_81523/g.231007 Transcript_81523/m.231007 type:complete len:426 (+) Transcript_81523:88-1365(+)
MLGSYAPPGSLRLDASVHQRKVGGVRRHGCPWSSPPITPRGALQPVGISGSEVNQLTRNVHERPAVAGSAPPSHDLQHADLPVRAADGGQLRAVGEVDAEDGLREVDEGPEGRRRLARRAVEDLRLVLLGAAREDHGAVRVLAELRGEEHAGRLRRRGAPLHVLAHLARPGVPYLQGLLRAPGAGEDLLAVGREVDRVPREVAVPQGAHRVAPPRVPDLHRVVPASGQQYVGVHRVVLQREDAVRVPGRVLHVAPLERLDVPLRGLVVDAHEAVPAACRELAPVAEVVDAEDLVLPLRDGVQALPRLDVPVEDLPVELRVDRDQHALRLRLRRVGTPPQLRRGERRRAVLALRVVEDVLLLARLGAVDVDRAVRVGGGQVLVVGGEADAEAVRDGLEAWIARVLCSDPLVARADGRHFFDLACVV